MFLPRPLSNLSIRRGASLLNRKLSSSSSSSPSPSSNNNNNINNSNTSIISRFWRWTTQERPNWKENNAEKAMAILIFGITGTTAVSIIRPTISTLFGVQGSLIDGPNSYRVFSLLFISPFYAITLLAVGTAFGRHIYFAKMSKKILGRFLPSSLREKIACPRR